MDCALRYVLLLTLPCLLAACGGDSDHASGTPSSPVSSDIIWQQQDNLNLPAGVTFHRGQKEGHTQFSAWYLKLDPSVAELALNPIRLSPVKTLDQLTEPHLVAAMNGGFFGGDQSYSAAIKGNEVLSKNIAALSRFNKTYPVMRALFLTDTAGKSEVTWIYHFGDSVADIRQYDQPLAYQRNSDTPQPAPQAEDGRLLPSLGMAIGGGPMLVQDGATVLSYDEEIFWGSGVELTDTRPRSAIGYTAQGYIILFVTNALTLTELPGHLLKLGVEGAINLDGGGSSALRVLDDTVFNQHRPVPIALTISQEP
ncbi:phosphodiester glycosidase family protein [Alkalimonas collagenimarina]|uniref:Phosphodiester glycosidase family protein n=1 Tax=Alkalimonas collagenimarina TaxID=400390 RepID=A0ABT9H026_9GAMM|nr:phosphodiester glycosidase family protein [Alkalimonas collagenimarina]MDP4536652.1 phosphodiester glycosidase family protein [Alkalimonas collagenimarina]